MRILKIITIVIAIGVLLLFLPGKNDKEEIVCFEESALVYRSFRKISYTPKLLAPFAFIIKYPKGRWKVPKRCSFFTLLLQFKNNHAINDTRMCTFIEGMHARQVLDIINGDKDLSGKLIIDLPEGVVFPDTYFFKVGCKREKIIELAVKNMQKKSEKIWRKYSKTNEVQLSKNLKLTKQDWIILASIVQKEGRHKEDMIKIAACFLFRLRNNIRLQSDVSVLYGLGEINKKRVYWQDLAIKTDHNTYKIDGLPKTPICNPGANALEAVLEAITIDGPYHYFYACDYTILFAKTLKEHNKNKRSCLCTKRA